MDHEPEIFKALTTQPRITGLAGFLRSVMPADPWQLVFLTGTIFLFISPRLAWRPMSLTPAMDPTSTSSAADQRIQFVVHLNALIWPIIIGSLVSYFSCFWSGIRPLRRILAGVFLPTLLGLTLILYEYYRFTHPVRSVFESSGPAVALYKWLGANLWKFPTGVYFCFFGLILLATFTVRIYLGSSSLPVLLRKEPHSSGETEGRWNRYKWLIFTLVGPIFLLAGLAVLLGILPHLFAIHPLSSILATVLAAFTKTVDGLILIVVALLILGKSERKTAWKCVQLPEAKFVLCALLLPLAISLLVSAAPYFMDRAQWAANNFGKTSPPLFGTYFEVGPLRDPWLAFLLLGAFGEEIVFRGLLLRQFMRRYGVHRAVFFTGIVWAAVHFRSDSYVGLSVAWVLYHLAWRILACLAWNYVFCWMTLRWRSVIPAAAAHTALNILIISGINRNVAWSAEYGLILWGIAGVVLFRYWPLKNEENGIVEIATA